MRPATWLLGFLAVATAAPSPQPGPGAPQDAATLYAELLDTDFDPRGAVVVEDRRLVRGPATLDLRHGLWIPLTPVAGRVTGAFFVGDGRFIYEPPEGVERDQVEKFTEAPTVDARFEELYLRFTDGSARAIGADALPATDREAVERTLRRARDLREESASLLLEKQNRSLEPRILSDLVEEREGLFVARVDTDEHGPVTFRRDPERVDLYSLTRWSERYGGILDTWSAYGPGHGRGVAPRHYELDVTLDGDDLVEAHADLTFIASEPGIRVVRFTVSPLVEVHEVLDAVGQPLFFARRRSGDDAETGLWVAFPQELFPDDPIDVTFVFDGEILRSVGFGRLEYALEAPTDWYPLLGELQRATYRATFRIGSDHDLYGSGELVSDETIGDRRVLTFRQEMPVALFSFAYGKMSNEVVEIEGLPPVTVFGESTGLGAGSRRENIGIDVANSMRLFEQIYGEYPFSYMYATRIPYPHGQGFPGLLHLSAGTFRSEVKGASEAFRAHEVAHQWWGHVVGWKTYRDQWISEGFAEYSGALYASLYHQEPEILDRMVAAWRNDVLRVGNLRASLGMDRFGMPREMMRMSRGSASGPISLGRRLVSSVAPADYNILVYEKGAYVLHMLRMLMLDLETGDDERFREMMRDFVATHHGAAASTADFRRVVERHLGIEMGWFFDQWVHGTAIPTYRWAWTTERDGEGLVFRLRVRQEVEPDVPFGMPVLVRIELDGGRGLFMRVPVGRPDQSFEVPVAREPERVVFNWGHAVLARVEEESW